MGGAGVSELVTQPRFLSIFAGIGGLDLGLERAGFRCVGQVEIDAACRSILSRHWPRVRRHDDVRSFEGWMLDEFPDFICGGFPCQDASIMRGRHGERDGVFGTRTGLVWELLRVVEEMRPLGVILENVRGLLSANQGASFRAVICALDELGYVGQWRVVDGAAFGLPLRREHLLIVARDSRPRGVSEGFGLADAEDRDAAGPQLLEGTRQPFTENGRPVAGKHYRLLTPEECEAGLGFPEGWTSGQSRTARYKQLGNAVAVPVAEWVGRRILATLTECEVAA